MSEFPIKAGTWSRVSRAATFDTRLSAAAFRVLAALGSHADEIGHCYPSVSTIAARLGLDRRTAQRHLRKLEAAGYIQSLKRLRIKGGGYASNEYLLRFPTPPATTDGASAGVTTGESNPDSGEGSARASGQPGAIASDAAPDAASPRYDATPDAASTVGDVTKTRWAMRHLKASDAASHAAPDAAPGAALTIPVELSQSERAQSRAGARECARESHDHEQDRDSTGRHRVNGNGKTDLQMVSEAEDRATHVDLRAWAEWIDSRVDGERGAGWLAIFKATEVAAKAGEDESAAILRIDALLRAARRRVDNRRVDKWLVDMMARGSDWQAGGHA